MAELPPEVVRLLSALPEGSGTGGVDLLLGQLDSDKAQCLRLCAIPHHFNPSILQVLSPALDNKQAEVVCAELATLALVRGHSDRLTIHDEARRHLFNRWLEPPRREEFREVSARLVKYFMPHQPQAAGTGDAWLQHAIFHSVGADQQSGFTGFENYCRQMRRQFRLSECENIIRLMHEYDPILTPEQRLRLTYHEAKLAADRGQWDTAEQLLGQLNTRDGLPADLRFRAQDRLGLVLTERRDFPTAIKHLEAALDVSKELDQSFRGRALHDLGVAFREKGDIDEAEKLLCESLEVARETKDSPSLALVHSSLGTLYRKRGDLGLAVANYQKSIEYLEATDRLRRAQVYNAIGAAYERQREWKKAEEFYLQSLGIMDELGYKTGQGSTLNNLGLIYRNRQQIEQAITAFRDAVGRFEEVRDWYRAAETKRNLARTHRTAKQRDAARIAFEEAADLFKRAKIDVQETDTRTELRRMLQPTRLPWWIWAAMVIAVLLALLIGFALQESEWADWVNE